MRVIAGELGGRRLRAPRGTGTRPTADRGREAMVSLIGPLEGVRVVDLYAGSGALAIEALSRGALDALLVEKSAPALAALRQNLADLGLASRATVLPTTALRALPTLAKRGPFGLVLVDPPYAEVANGSVAKVLAKLAECGSLASGALIVLEHAAKDEPPALSGATVDRSRRYGDSAVTIYYAD